MFCITNKDIINDHLIYSLKFLCKIGLVGRNRTNYYRSIKPVSIKKRVTKILINEKKLVEKNTKIKEKYFLRQL